MTEHTPDFHEVRGAYISRLPDMFTEKRVAEFDRFIAKVKADALREAAVYFAGGLHCADMRTTPEETVRDLYSRADRIEGEA